MDIPHAPQRWEYLDLLELRTRCENYGLRLEAIENVPVDFYDKAMLGLPGRDEQIENYQTVIRHLGAAGIPILGYHWMPNLVWRTSFSTPGRGGAECTAFDMALVEQAPLTHGRVFDTDEMWANYAYFIQAVMPVAEEVDVTLALHPDDPPVPMLGGVARLFWNQDGIDPRASRLPPAATTVSISASPRGPKPEPTSWKPSSTLARWTASSTSTSGTCRGVCPGFRSAFLAKGTTIRSRSCWR